MCRADFCANYLPSLVCQTCIQYYTLDANQRCIADCAIGTPNKCVCCKYGFSLNTTSSLCQPSSTFCTQTNQATSFCTSCILNYVLVSGQCIAPVANCKTPSLFGCLACNAGYQIADNCRCVPKYCL